MNKDVTPPFRLGDWKVNPTTGRLTPESGEEVPLRPKVMELLVYLASHAGELVSNDDLITQVWKDVHVSDASLYYTINQLRNALGDDRNKPAYIETIPKRGYRLIADIATVTDTDVPAPAPVKASVAVLPFVSLGGDQGNEYFADGLSEELLNVLSKIDSLKVAARTSSFHFKGKTGDIAEIARALGVAAVLEGSVRQSGQQVRITAQLISASDGFHLWSETFDRKLDDIFAVQDEIASSVAEALKVKLLGVAGGLLKVGGTTNTEAFQAYLEGMHYRNRGPEEAAMKNAIKSFQRAIELDPGYARAYAGEAKGWDELTANDCIGLDEGVGKATAAATKAVELAPDLADAHQVLGRILLIHKMDFGGARKAIERAVELNPGSVDVQIQCARVNAVLGKHETSIAAARKAQALDPFSLNANHFLLVSLYLARRYDEAISAGRHALNLDPHHPRLHFTISNSQFMLGDPESALQEIEKETLGWMNYSGRAIVLQRLGRVEEAEDVMKLLLERYAENGTYQHAQVYAQWGDTDRAMEALNLAYEIGDPGLSWLMVEPMLDPVRDDPRFVELMEKTGFAALQK